MDKLIGNELFLKIAIVVILILVGISFSIYLVYWGVEAEDCYGEHQYVRIDLNSHLGNVVLDQMNEAYYSCLENKFLPVLEKVRFDIDFINDDTIK